jgi:hypothetical protein
MFGKDLVTTSGAKALGVTASSQTLTSTLATNRLYSLATATALWVKQGFGAQTAAAATANNVFVPAGGTIYLHGGNGDTVAVVQDTAPGNCSINMITEI